MTISIRILLAASLCLAPLGWAAAQDQLQQRDEQHKRDQKDEHPQQRLQQQQPPHNQQPQNAAPQGQHTGGPAPSGPGGGPVGGQQFQRPVQNNPPPAVQPVQRQPQIGAPSPPAAATAAPAPPPSQVQRVQGPAPIGSGAAAGAAAGTPPPQQFQQRSVQRNAPAIGAAPPQRQAQPQPPRQQTTTNARGNFSGGTRGGNTANFAQRHGGAAPTSFDHGRFYGRDYGHFTPRDRDLWRRGAWHHEFHDGRFGWWYAVDGIWYFYDEPVYPYPTFIPEVVYIPEEEDDVPPVYVDAPPEPPQPQPQYGQPPAYYYYFCPDTRTYYPYVSSCASPWQPVPATPQ